MQAKPAPAAVMPSTAPAMAWVVLTGMPKQVATSRNSAPETSAHAMPAGAEACSDRTCWQATLRRGGAARGQGTTAAPEDSSVMFNAEGSLVTIHCQHAGLVDPLAGKLSCPCQPWQPSNLRPVPSMKKSMRPLGMPQPQHSSASSLLMDLTKVSLTPTVHHQLHDD